MQKPTNTIPLKSKTDWCSCQMEYSTDSKHLGCKLWMNEWVLENAGVQRKGACLLQLSKERRDSAIFIHPETKTEKGVIRGHSSMFTCSWRIKDSRDRQHHVIYCCRSTTWAIVEEMEGESSLQNDCSHAEWRRRRRGYKLPLWPLTGTYQV